MSEREPINVKLTGPNIERVFQTTEVDRLPRREDYLFWEGKVYLVRYVQFNFVGSAPQLHSVEIVLCGGLKE